MKTIFAIISILTVGQLAFAETTSFVCTSASGSVQVFKDKIFKTVGLGMVKHEL